MDQPSDTERNHLAWAGLSQSVELSESDFEPMEVAISLVPELRLAALAVSRSRQFGIEYPINSTGQIKKLLGDSRRVVAGGHEIGEKDVHRYLVSGDLPIDDESALANVVYIALMRCRQHEQLLQAIANFEAGLTSDPDKLRPDPDQSVDSDEEVSWMPGPTANWVFCPAGQWTYVSNQPAPFAFIYVWSRDSTVSVRWRRYQAGVPFFTDSSATIPQGQNTWVVPPDFVNTWWFNPTTDATLRLT